MMSEPIQAVQGPPTETVLPPKEQLKLYHIRFRDGLQPKAASAKVLDLVRGDAVMVQTDHGPEFAHVCGSGIELPPIKLDRPPELLSIIRRSNNEEMGRYQNLLQREQDARRYCQGLIHNLRLGMKLLQVQRYFNGSKVIFYFSSETRVDFRDLVKALVQEFRTRVEMRQIGVRHETQMLGGLGCCGRELCCGLFMKEFVPVSIKMAKEQDLPLNPTKISGVCNRLLCCLTHEYETYKALKKGMPKVGRVITFDDKPYKVNYCKTLNGTVSVTAVDDARDTRVLSREEWEQGVSVVKPKVEAEDWSAPPPKPEPRPPAALRQTVGLRPGRPKPAPGRQPSAAVQQPLERGGAAHPLPNKGLGQSSPVEGPAPQARGGGGESPRKVEPRPFPPAGKRPSPKKPPVAAAETLKNQGARPEAKKGEDGKPLAGPPSRSSRRAKSRRKGKAL